MNLIREMLYRLRKKEKVKTIADEMGVSRNTVKKYRGIGRKHGLLDPEKALPEIGELQVLLGSPPPPPKVVSSIEPFGEFVKEKWSDDVEMVAIYQMLVADKEYKGSYSSVRRYIAANFPENPEAFCRVETEPGKQAQVDFGYSGVRKDPGNGRLRKSWVFVMTMSCSRHQYVEFVFDQRIETWLTCHEHAFEWFGGVPEKVVIDNLKAAVIKREVCDAVLGEPYRKLAQHYGFIISPNRPRTPRHKGKVESGVRYVKRNFLAGKEFIDIDHMNAEVKKWVMETAGTREHGTTHEAPLQFFNTIERHALQPLPATPFDLVSAHHAQVHNDCHVVIDGRYYSVPCQYIEQYVEVYVGRKLVEIYKDGVLITTHSPLAKKGLRATRTEHYPPGKREYLENTPEVCLSKAEKVGPFCRQVVATLLGDRVLDRLSAAQAVLRLEKTYNRERLEAACRRAVHFDTIGYQKVKSILKEGMDMCQDIVPGMAATPEMNYQYARPAAEFFQSREVH